MGWTRAKPPKCRAVSWNTNPKIMLAMPSTQTGWRARRNTSRTSKPAVSVLLAPLRWHTDAVAVHNLAAAASTIALSISCPISDSLAGLRSRRPDFSIPGRQRGVRGSPRSPCPGWCGLWAVAEERGGSAVTRAGEVALDRGDGHFYLRAGLARRRDDADEG